MGSVDSGIATITALANVGIGRQPWRFNRRRAGVMALLLAGISLGSVGTAHAATCTSTTPVAPPAQTPVNSSLANQTVGTGNPVTIDNRGAAGCDGIEAADDNDGSPAGAGGASANVTATLTNITVTGASLVDAPNARAVGVLLDASGGTGGVGGFGGSAFITEVAGGVGGAGGAAGAASLTFSGSVDLSSVPLAGGIGLEVRAVGGNGNVGGGTGGQGEAGTFGGNGGAGANGAAASITASGNMLVSGAGLFADASGGDGGAGGTNIVSFLSKQIHGGVGAAAGTGGTANVAYDDGVLTGRRAGIVAIAGGGRGGDGGGVGTTGGQVTGAVGGDAGAGGNAATATATLGAGGSIVIDRSGLETPGFPWFGAVTAISAGGDGGNGASAQAASFNATGGSGGNGGNGSAASATVLGSILFSGEAGDTVQGAIDVYSGGGRGGSGGNATGAPGQAGGGGLAGNGGQANLTFGSADTAANVRVEAALTAGALVQSIGGGGGGGGSGRGWNVIGGSGAAGGSGGAVNATILNGRLIADGSSATALIAQSIGGGGGVGGDATNVAIGANLGVGGNGGLGGAGGPVTIAIGTDAIIGSIDLEGDHAVLAQSIGGAGGKAGSAVSSGSGFLVMTVGGDGGTGAAANAVTINNDGIVTSFGSHAPGLQAQSIGGGGGDGGAAISNSFGIVPTSAVAIGGRGGEGGTGGAVSIHNMANGQVTTYGSNSYAILAQSVGGGGGTGGIAAARAVSFSLDPDVPAISVSIALGGSGGTGNTGGNVSLINDGLVMTSGEQSYAVLAQSVGGGGGVGGDATAMSYSGGFTDDADVPPIAVSVALGASGGSGGAAGTVGLTNSGLIMTLGTDAVALMAQSVGGGGGAGGAGDSLAVANDPENENPDDPDNPDSGKSLGVSVSVGGTGGTGGHGGAVTLDNSGAITTSGDGADAFYAQSVGGGGGTAGGGVANAGGNTLTVAIGLGGAGGAGGDGGDITASNTGIIVTRGADAAGLYVQSVGGGGGEAGKGASTSGGVDNVAKSAVLFDIIASGFNASTDVTDVGDGLFKVGGYVEATKGVEELLDLLAEPKATLKSLINQNLDLSLSIGGQGGAAGHGGNVALTNAGQIWTTGAQSDGIFAQSVGGGGGKGGTTSSTGSSYDDTRNQVSLGVSGGGGAAGDGGTVSVTNAAGASITTRSALAFGIYAQSVGGGGGAGANSQDVNGSLESLALGFNGRDGAQGKGGAVSVTNAGSIATQGKNGIGIIAQSVGGGGGLVKSMTTDMTFDPDELSDNPQGRLFDIHGFNLTFGGGTNSEGDGGAVTVTNSGAITTNLRNAHAILAQSVGGGGGITIGGQLLGRREDGTVPPPNTGNGNGGKVLVALDQGTSIATAGDGAYGVFAQSIGGGGGFAGDMSNISTTTRTLTNLVIHAGNGNGGDVTVNLQNATVQTAGLFAAGILAQSVGGGGGVLAQKGELQIGAGGGTGVGGVVTVALVNAHILTAGLGAPAILTYTNGPGGADGAAIVNIDAMSRVQATGDVGAGGGLGAAITMLSPTLSVVNNEGQISATNVAAIAAPHGALTVKNSGQITGTVGTNDALAVTNSGTMTGDLSGGPGSSVVNSGTIGGGTIGFNSADTGASNPAGTIQNLAGGVLANISHSGTLALTNAGTINGTLTAINGVMTITNSGTISGSIGGGGSVQLTNGGTMSVDILTSGRSTLTNNGTLTAARLQLGGGTFTNNGNFFATNSDGVSIDGSLAAGGTVHLAWSRGGINSLNITGSAGFGGEIMIQNAANGNSNPQTVIIADGGVTSLPTRVIGDNYTSFYEASLLDPNTVVLQAYADYAASQTNISATQAAVAEHLNAAYAANDPGLRPVLVRLGQAGSAEEAVANLSAISGQSLLAVSAIRYETSLAHARSLWGCPTFADDTTLLKENSCVWLRVEGNWADREAEQGFAGYRYSGGSLSIGGQKQVSDQWFVGGAIGYQNGKLEERGGLADVTSDGLFAAVSVKRQDGPLSLGVATGLGYAWFDSRRTIPVAGATARATSGIFNWGLHGRAAWRFGNDRFYAEPALEAGVTFLKVGDYTEVGAAPFDLEVRDGSDWIFNIMPGARVGARIDGRGGRIVDVFAFAGPEFILGADLSAQARFVAATNSDERFTATLAADDVVARLSAGVRIFAKERLEVNLQYDGRLSSLETWHGGQARFVWRF